MRDSHTRRVQLMQNLDQKHFQHHDLLMNCDNLTEYTVRSVIAHFVGFGVSLLAM